ncbi:MAG: TIGR01459 family HAD-type hydrolase [Rhodobacteraceae bacterium]|nr:TIGR01459 family HAD-type hydrolase [Paracoccaceae bacterium]
MTRIISNLAEVSGKYGAVFCDLWGCLHDGVRPFAEAVAALQTYRARGGVVVLLTNAPRHRKSVEKHLGILGVPRDCWDVIVSSGDSARAAMYRGVVGEKVWFMGEKHDLSFFDPIRVVANPVTITQVGLEEAEGIVCCGPFDPFAPPEDLRPKLLFAKQKGMKLLCANPDLIVDRGEKREYCAGAIAALYTEMGGNSLYFGKPHPPIYDLARARLAELGQDLPNARILAIGDGISTDIAGAMGEDIDSMFITGGLAADETGTIKDGPEPEATKAFIAKHMTSPTYVAGWLR